MAMTENVRDRARDAAREIRRYIETGINQQEFRGGDKLPNERDLAAQFKTGRNTVRKALIALEHEGRIERTVGRGTFVKAGNAFDLQRLGGKVQGAADTKQISKSASPQDLMEFRLALEPDVVAICVERASTSDIERMEAIVKASRAAIPLRQFEALDDDLHRAMVEACRNALFMAAANLVSAVRAEAEWGNIKKRALTDDLRRLHTREHVAIVAAIRRRDAAEASEAMRRHLLSVRNMMFPGK